MIYINFPSTINGILLLCCLFFVEDIKGQDIIFSEPYHIGRKMNPNIIGKFNNEILLYTESYAHFSIQAFNKDLEPTWNQKIDFPTSNVKTLHLITLKNTFYLLYSYTKKHKRHLALKKWDLQNKKVEDIALGVYPLSHEIRAKNFLFSKDERYMGYYLIRNNHHLELELFDLAQQKRLWEKSIKLANLSSSRTVEEAVLTNNGQIFFILNKNNSRRKNKEHQLIVHSFKLDGRHSFQKNAIKGVSFLDANFAYDEVNKQLMGTGFYGESPKSAAGIFYLSNLNKQALTYAQIPFDERLIRSLTGNGRKRIKGINNLEMQNLILRKDGGVLLFAEQIFKYEQNPMGDMYPDEILLNSQVNYLYENILVASIHPNGSLHWKDVLFKKQHSENDQGAFSSFFIFKGRNLLRLLYNNEVKRGSSLFEYNITPIGETERKVLRHEKKRSDILASIRYGIQLNSSEFIALSRDERHLRLLHLRY